MVKLLYKPRRSADDPPRTFHGLGLTVPEGRQVEVEDHVAAHILKDYPLDWLRVGVDDKPPAPPAMQPGPGDIEAKKKDASPPSPAPPPPATIPPPVATKPTKPTKPR